MGGDTVLQSGNFNNPSAGGKADREATFNLEKGNFKEQLDGAIGKQG